MKSHPARLLMELILVALAAGGLIHGFSEKRPGDEQLMDLYRRIEALDAENQRLLKRVEELREEGAS